MSTWHTSTRPAELHLEANDDEWIALEVLESDIRSAEHAWVHFIAYSRHKQKLYALKERSRFVCEEGRWLYVDGDCEIDLVRRGRNESCICGSGKKFKRCCGR